MEIIEQAHSGSFLYRLDPRTKLLLTALFTTLVFIVDTPVVAAGQMLFFIFLCIGARIPLKKIFPHFKFLLFLVALVIVLQTLFGREVPGSHYLLKPLIPEWVPLAGGLGSLNRDGLFTGLMIGFRIIALTVLMPMLTMTTEAWLLAFGITRLGLNYKAAYVISSTLNLIPSFEEEARLIMDARRLRGVEAFKSKSFFKRLREYPALALPLIIKAMRRAFTMGLAMDSRAFGAYKTRTWLFQTRMSVIDYGAFAAGIIWSLITVTANYALKR